MRHILVPCSCFFPLKTRNTKRLLLKLTQHLVAVPPGSCSLFRGGCAADIGEATAFLRQILLAWYGQKVMLPAVQLSGSIEFFVGKNRSRNITSTSKRTSIPRLSTDSWLSCEVLPASKAWRSFAQGVAQTSYKRPCCNESERNAIFSWL